MTAELMTPAAYAVGCQVKLETTFGEVEGEVFAYDEATGCLVLKQEGSTPQLSNLRLLMTEKVLRAVVEAGRAGEEPEELPAVDLQRCRDREEKAVKAAELEAAKIGVGVTKEAQQLFTALAKTLPCCWDGKDIVVLGEIIITEPYGPENCRSLLPDDVKAMERVKKVLEAERKLLGHASA